MSMRTPLGRVRGLGSAKNGTDNFWRERITSVALVPLTVAFVCIVIALVGRSHEEAVALIGWPPVTVLMLALVLTGVAHMRLGMQVFIEDYVHSEGAKVACLMANTFFCALIAIACVWAIVKLSFGI